MSANTQNNVDKLPILERKCHSANQKVLKKKNTTLAVMRKELSGAVESAITRDQKYDVPRTRAKNGLQNLLVPGSFSRVSIP
mmetsp:Transcript_17605/g.30333  ORF Transcript_17605/g.30333 Transcript_17605/m.30333 type:complete len:82 (+) Transcript_17605:553-798(+)